MARISSGSVTEGFKGKVGNIVFRTRNGKTSAYYLEPIKHKPTFKQRMQRYKFRMAVQYAKSVVKDLAAKERYEAMAKKVGKENAYTMALTDHLEDLRYSKIFFPEEGGDSATI